MGVFGKSLVTCLKASMNLVSWSLLIDCALINGSAKRINSPGLYPKKDP